MRRVYHPPGKATGLFGPVRPVNFLITDYRKEKMLDPYLKSNWFFQRESSQKINVTQQNKITCNQPEASKVIKRLKIYR